MRNNKIEKYHFEEMILILLILSSDLSKYDDNDLMSFSESIEGRIEVLFTRDFLLSLNKKFGITNNIVFELENLKALVTNLYESEWIKKLTRVNSEVDMIRLRASQILNVLKIKDNDPKKFSEEHLNVDW